MNSCWFKGCGTCGPTMFVGLSQEGLLREGATIFPLALILMVLHPSQGGSNLTVSGEFKKVGLGEYYVTRARLPRGGFID